MTRLCYSVPRVQVHRQSLQNEDLEQLSDEELLLCFEAGEREAFSHLFRRHRQRLFRFILRFLRDEQASEDAVQDLFLRVISDPSRFQARSRFSTWLHTVARNLCIDMLRKRKRRNHLSLDQPMRGRDGELGSDLASAIAGSERNPEEETSDGMLRIKMLVAIRALPDEQRVVYLLRVLGGLPFHEIALAVGVPVNTAKSRMRYALINLRGHLHNLGIRASDVTGQDEDGDASP